MELANKTLHRLIAARKSVIGNQILPDSFAIASTTEPLVDQFAVRLAGAGGSILVFLGR